MPVATETALSMFQLGQYRGQTLRLRLTWGAEDLAAALGASTEISRYRVNGRHLGGNGAEKVPLARATPDCRSLHSDAYAGRATPWHKERAS